MENDARIVNATTPRFAQMCARKYASMNRQLAREDLRQSHRREVSRCYLQDTAAAVADIVQSKGEHWRYTPAIDGVVASVAVGIDATSVLYCQEGYRMAMVGTLSLYDYEGDRLHSIYVAHPPQYGKEHFLKKMEREIELLRERYPWAHWVGVADGAKDNWPWLEGHTQTQVLDYFHAWKGPPRACARARPRARSGSNAARTNSNIVAARRLLEEMKQGLSEGGCRAQARRQLEAAAGYFENNLGRMDYWSYRRQHLPIGSGVTEAACKSVVKERMSGSGMKWKYSGASTILNLRTLLLSSGRWESFWSKISQYGC